jgi:hypothetical protein
MGWPHICTAPPRAAASYSVPLSESVSERRSGQCMTEGVGAGGGRLSRRVIERG